jgi:phospholipid/cholesterol/gamma-HCH transport system substrate-binding protein
VEGVVAENEKTIKSALDEFEIALNNANIFLEKGSSLVSNTDDSISNLVDHLLTVARDLEKAGDNLNRIVELVADQPSQLIFGEPPAPRAVEKESDLE